MSKPIVVIGVGVPDRGDDASGRVVAEVLSERTPPGVRVRSLRGETGELMEAWAGAGGVVLIDAMRTGSEAGRVLRLDASDRALPADMASTSTHGMGLSEAIELSRALGTLPARVVVFGIEGASFALGESISGPVRVGIDECVRCVLGELARLTGSGEEKGPSQRGVRGRP